MIHIKRAYEAVEEKDGERFLVDRLWPRGVKKEALAISGWLKEAAPSNELRHWYHHDLSQWDEFRQRYFSELEQDPASWLPLVEAARHGTITLLYGSKHAEHNNALALKDFLTERLRGKKKR